MSFEKNSTFFLPKSAKVFRHFSGKFRNSDYFSPVYCFPDIWILNFDFLFEFSHNENKNAKVGFKILIR